jgi:FHS family L-fucose permease-like MFS transporter
MLVGRIASSAISGKVSSRTQLITVSTVALVFVVVAILLPKSITVSMPGYSADNGFLLARVPISALFLVLCGLCTSVMWGCIFNLAVEGLGKYTEKASGIFMMMVVGGGILPFVQQIISDSVGYMLSYILIVFLFAFILYYALIGCKNVNKDIPVE